MDGEMYRYVGWEMDGCIKKALFIKVKLSCAQRLVLPSTSLALRCSSKPDGRDQKAA